MGIVYRRKNRHWKPPRTPLPRLPPRAHSSPSVSLRHVATWRSGTDAGVFARAGIPGVVLGPGSIDVAHTSREFVPISEVEIMVRIFERLLEGEGPSAV